MSHSALTSNICICNEISLLHKDAKWQKSMYFDTCAKKVFVFFSTKYAHKMLAKLEIVFFCKTQPKISFLFVTQLSRIQHFHPLSLCEEEKEVKQEGLRSNYFDIICKTYQVFARVRLILVEMKRIEVLLFLEN